MWKKNPILPIVRENITLCTLSCNFTVSVQRNTHRGVVHRSVSFFSKANLNSCVLTPTGNTLLVFRGTQRIVSVEYLFGRPVIASNFRLGKCHLELS